MTFQDKFQNFVEVLKQSARTSAERNKHGAGLIKSKKLISIGVNVIKSNGHISIHAEEAALLYFNKADRKFLKGMDIIIIRVDKSLTLQNSRPCNSCIDKLREYGIKKAFYSTSNGDIVFEFVDDMPKKHECSFFKAKHSK